VKVKIQIIIESDEGNCQILQQVTQIERGILKAENLGLNLAEAKNLLQTVQKTLVEKQIAEYEKHQEECQQCEKKLLRKDKRTIVYRTLFGKLKLQCNRLFHCDCQKHPTRTFKPLVNLLRERTAPELLYLESKFASLMSYGLSVKLLEELLPIEGEISSTTVRKNLHTCAQRLESELGEEKGEYIEGCQREWDKLPQPDLPIVVGMDGGYVRFYDKKLKSAGNFEVIVGKSRKSDNTFKCFGGVYCYDTKPQRRIFETLKSQGMQMNQQVTFLSDGDEKLRDLIFGITPHIEYILDWFHITMRLTVMNQTAKGIKTHDIKLDTDIPKELERIKWYLWHGNVFRGLQLLKQLVDDLEIVIFEGNKKPEVKKLFKMVQEFETYISNNGACIPNYGERWRCGEAISTGFVESTVNQVISKRFVKKQQMRWTPRGTHLLLQVRIQVLNGELSRHFQKWYSGFLPL